MKKRLFKIALLASMMLTYSCSGNDDSEVVNNENPILGNDDSPNTSSEPESYKLGGQGPGGGIIFQIDESGEHGLEVSKVIGFVRWWNTNQNSYNIPNLQEGAGTGMSNTEKIIANLGNEGEYAAKLCADFVQGGKDDWYLPSKFEIEKIFSFYKYGPDCGDCFSIFETLWSSSPKYATNFEGQQVIGGIWGTDFAVSASWPEIVILPLTPYADGGLHVRAVRAF